METTFTRKVSAIVGSERRLEAVINKLTQKTVSLHEVTVQGTPDKMAEKFGTGYIKPAEIQHSAHPPKKEPFLNDDFGWVLGFSFSVPLFIGIIIGVFLIGDIRSTEDNYFYGVLGAIFGGSIGAIFTRIVRKHRLTIQQTQEKKGGFVLWVTVTNDEQLNDVLAILEEFNATHITVE